jgi:photosystem II stability/assembly factor-like uncharacterized protein
MDARQEGGESSLESGLDAPKETGLTDAPAEGDGETPCTWGQYSQGLSGASVVDVLFDIRSMPPALYATAGAALYQSSDLGQTWAVRGKATGGSIGYLATPANNPNLLLASSGNGVLSSTDSGATWSIIAFNNVATTSIAVAASQPLRAYVGLHGSGLFRSDDQGMTWIPALQGYPNTDTVAIDVAPDNPDEVVTAALLVDAQGNWTGNGVIMRTTDAGQTWQTVRQGEGSVWNVRRCTSNPSVMYAGDNAGLVKSSDRGATWTLTSVGGNVVEDVEITPGSCNDIYIMAQFGGVFHSTDGGMTLGSALNQGLQLVPPGTFPGRMAIQPGNDNNAIVGSHGGIWYTSNGGMQWNGAMGLLDMEIRSLQSSPLNPSQLWLASWGSGVWQRSSPNAQWQRISTQVLPVDYAITVAPDPYTTGRVFVGDFPTLWESTDGTTFFNTGITENEFSFAFDPTSPSTVYIATQKNGVYKSSAAGDGGLQWSPSNGNLMPWPTAAGNFIDVRSIVIDPNSPQTLFIGTNGEGLFKTTDAGNSWQNVLAPTGIIDCLLLAGSPATLYACVGGSGMQASTDGGGTWSDISPGLPSQDVNGLAADGTTGTLYATVGPGVYVKQGTQPWAGFDLACLPGSGAGTPAILTSGSSRLLVVGTAGGVYSHPL